LVVRPEDLVEKEPFRGGDLQVDGCHGRLRNICKAALEEDVRETQETSHAALSRMVDKFTKDEVGRAEVVVELSAQDDGPPFRIYVLLGKAVFNPKCQLWFRCQWDPENSQDEQGVELAFPFTIRLEVGSCRLCPAVPCLAYLSSDELALQMAQISDGWSANRLVYRLPTDVDNLMTMIVEGRTPCADFAAGPRAQARGSRNQELSDLQDLVAPAPRLATFGGERRRDRGAPAGAKRPRRGERLEDGDVVDEGAALGCIEGEGDLIGEMDLDDVRDLIDPFGGSGSGGELRDPDEDEETDEEGLEPLPLAEGDKDKVIVIDGDDHVPGEAGELELRGLASSDVAAAAAAAGSGASSSSHEVVLAESGVSGPVYGPIAPDEIISGPTPLGYLRDLRIDRDVCRQTAWGTNVGVKCYIHGPKCSVASPAWRALRVPLLKVWILNSTPAKPGETKATLCEMAAAHTAEFRTMRDAAVDTGP
jgi:hypothetical protein